MASFKTVHEMLCLCLIEEITDEEEFVLRIVFKHLLFVYKSLNGLCPQYLRNLLEHRKSARSLRSNFQDLLIQPTCKTKTYGDRAFSVCGPKIWNTVPLEIRQSSTVVLFKKKLKTFLFTRFIESNSLSYF